MGFGTQPLQRPPRTLGTFHGATGAGTLIDQTHHRRTARRERKKQATDRLSVCQPGTGHMLAQDGSVCHVSARDMSVCQPGMGRVFAAQDGSVCRVSARDRLCVDPGRVCVSCVGPGRVRVSCVGPGRVGVSCVGPGQVVC